MSISIDDVRHIASLSRLGLTDEHAATAVAELNTILGHMEELSSVDTEGVIGVVGPGATSLPLRDDTGPALRMARPLDAFAPSVRDGLLLVPRLASHESSEEA